MTSDTQEEFLFLKLSPEVISENWDVYGTVLEQSLPTKTHRLMANVLKAILVDDLIVWQYTDAEDNPKYITTTCLYSDTVAVTRNLLIYSFTSLGDVKPQEVMNGFEKLKVFAKAHECDAIVAFVGNPRVKKFLESLGANCSLSFMQVEI